MANHSDNEKKPIYKKWWFWVIVIVIIAGIGGAGASNQDANTQTSTNTINTNSITSEIAKNTTEETTEPDIPKEYKNALKKAENYSSMMHMSKQAIYDQLTSEYGEQFPADAAQYAIDNLNADYKQNALEKAKSYQDNMNMSKSAIYDQLVSEYGEQFTSEEAQYAIDNL